MALNWRCPFCNRDTTITRERQEVVEGQLHFKTKYGPLNFNALFIACPNDECLEVACTAQLASLDRKFQERWTLRPRANVRVFPDYIPAAILQDYEEACLVASLSPKASATLARRCLQGMIRDFHNVVQPSLYEEILALEGKVDTVSWKAIDAVRHIGNIGAHMKKAANELLDIEEEEARLLISLIETLLEEWYVERHEREVRMNRVIEAADAKRKPEQ